MGISNRTHSTEDELNYIAAIGQHCKFTENISRKAMLTKYLEISKKRVNWLRMDKEVVLVYAKSELKLCDKGVI